MLRGCERPALQKNIVSSLPVTKERKKNAVRPGTVSSWKVNPAFWNEFKHRAWQAKEKSFFSLSMLSPAQPAHLMNITSFPVVTPSRNPHPLLFQKSGMQLKPKSRKHARHPDKAPQINKLRLWPAGHFVKQDIRLSFFCTWYSLLYASANAARSPEKIKRPRLLKND